MSADAATSSPLTRISQLPPIENEDADEGNSMQVHVGSATPRSFIAKTRVLPSPANPLGQLRQNSAHDTPPHITKRRYVPPPLRQTRSHRGCKHRSPSTSPPTTPSPSPSLSNHSARGSWRQCQRHYNCNSWTTAPTTPSVPQVQQSTNAVLKCKTLAGLPSWPSDLKLSLTAGNWLEWSCFLLCSLAMMQLDEYPLGLLCCPDVNTDPLGHHYWNGNDRMILGYMQSQMYSVEIQYINSCHTSAQAYQTLHQRHEK